MKKTLAYTRVSTEAQTEGNGISQQRKEIVTYAAMQELQIDEWLTDAKTGTTEDREQLNRIKAMAEAGEVGTLILDRMDRLGRTTEVNLSLLRQFEEWGVRVIFVQQAFEQMSPTMRKFMQTIFAALAEMQKAELLQRLTQCKQVAVANGRFIGGGVPYGYKLGVTPGQLAVDPKAAETIRAVFEYKARGGTYQQTANSLNDAGYRTQQGKFFTPMMVRSIILRKEFYMGVRTLHGAQHLNAQPVHEAILSPKV